LTLLLNNIGIKTGWRVIQGSPDFFSITKKDAQRPAGEEINLTEMKMRIYEEVTPTERCPESPGPRYGHNPRPAAAP
jgi:hypothetical protein